TMLTATAPSLARGGVASLVPVLLLCLVQLESCLVAIRCLFAGHFQRPGFVLDGIVKVAGLGVSRCQGVDVVCYFRLGQITGLFGQLHRFGPIPNFGIGTGGQQPGVGVVSVLILVIEANRLSQVFACLSIFLFTEPTLGTAMIVQTVIGR